MPDKRNVPQSVDGTGLLTRREIEVLLCVADDLGNKEIANRLGISVKTVEFHKTAVYQKLGVTGPAGVAKYAIKTGLIQP